MGESLKQIVEALLFAAEEPLSVAKLQEVAGGTSAEIRAAVAELKTSYDHNGHAFTIAEVAGGYRMLTRPEFSPHLAQLFARRRKTSLSPAALETLAIVAYKQPVTRAEVEAIRGVGCGDMLRNLIEVGLVRITGRQESLGRPLLYGTTRKFLAHFGLRTLRDLPKLTQLEAPDS